MPLLSTTSSRPRPARHPAPLATLASSRMASAAVSRTARDLPVLLRHNLASGPTEMNALKGAFGEGVARRLLDFTAPGALEWIEPLRRGGGQGIDLLAFQRDTLGRIRSVQVYEVKFGSSRPGTTLDGRQISKSWTSTRLRENAQKLREQALRTPGAEARLLQEKADYLLRAADGSLPLERHITRVEIKGSGFRISQQTEGSRTKRTLIEGPFARLPNEVQLQIRQSFEATFREAGCNAQEARRLAQEACRNPEFFRGMARDRRWTWRAGLDRTSAYASLGAAAVAAGLRIALDLLAKGRIDWRGVALSGLLGGAAGLAGSFAGVQTVALLTGTQAGRALTVRLLSTAAGRWVGVVGVGKLAGGVAGAVMFACGGALLGLTDWRTAHRAMGSTAIGLGASMGATSATFGAVAAFGTASTGTAISTLSGAAMVKATMAWLGGGSLASGGFGVAGGALVLGGVGAAVALAGTFVVGGIYRMLDEREHRAMVGGRIELAQFSLSAANHDATLTQT